MIKIIKGVTNSIPFTLNEKIVGTYSYFLLELYSNADKNSKVIRLGDERSTNTTRWNEFIIEETTSESLTQSRVNLVQGTYDYYVWQTATSSMLTSYASHILESGKCKVVGTQSTLIGTQSVNVTYNNTTDDGYTFI